MVEWFRGAGGGLQRGGYGEILAAELGSEPRKKRRKGELGSGLGRFWGEIER
jgi:hypothetical protein